MYTGKSETNLALLEKHLSELLQAKTRVEFLLEAGESGSAGPKNGPGARDAGDAPIVKTALGIFGGRVIKS